MRVATRDNNTYNEKYVYMFLSRTTNTQNCEVMRSTDAANSE